MRTISPPPSGSTWEDDRDQEAYDALEPHITLIAEAAIDVGWHEADLIAAFMGWALDRAVEGAGEDAAEEFLALARRKIYQPRTRTH
jgi:hypothetical protein